MKLGEANMLFSERKLKEVSLWFDCNRLKEYQMSFSPPILFSVFSLAGRGYFAQADRGSTQCARSVSDARPCVQGYGPIGWVHRLLDHCSQTLPQSIEGRMIESNENDDLNESLVVARIDWDERWLWGVLLSVSSVRKIRKVFGPASTRCVR